MSNYATWSKGELTKELAAWEHDLKSVQDFLREYPDDREMQKEQAQIIAEIATIKAYI